MYWISFVGLVLIGGWVLIASGFELKSKKYAIFSLIIAVGLFWYFVWNRERAKQSNIDQTNKVLLENKMFSIVVIDSCEYIIYSKQDMGGICHKENCKFCAERDKVNKIDTLTIKK